MSFFGATGGAAFLLPQRSRFDNDDIFILPAVSGDCPVKAISRKH
jgi:hypothetical protein